ncbi:cupin domain-containing protein [Nanoarchaeota archaeon]|nr:MAG: cupin domain-containing protein [Nanoarchaeota archaeon]
MSEEGSKKYSLVNINEVKPDMCDRSLRYHIKDVKNRILRDAYKLIEAGKSPSRRLTLGYTIVYPGGRTTGHSHDNMEEVYFIIQGRGIMEIGEDKFQIKEGDAFYIPPGKFHVTYNTGILPLMILWVTGKVD